jgi:hypothetical protein
MSKIMLLTITGGTETYSIGPARSLVSVQDDQEFLKSMRAIVLKKLIEESSAGSLPDDQQAEVLRTLKLRLSDTGLTEWPETTEELNALYERMTIEIPSNPDPSV